MTTRSHRRSGNAIPTYAYRNLGWRARETMQTRRQNPVNRGSITNHRAVFGLDLTYRLLHTVGINQLHFYQFGRLTRHSALQHKA